MAGIFGNSSTGNTNENTTRTPNRFKRYSLGSTAFCTSPGGLQDVTMENSYNSFDAARTQGIGGSSPIMLQGRSVRELEEQMSSLRKENFNLKLRIYFMEEGQTPVRGNNSHDSLSKQLVDLKIEIEVLRKAVAEKTELLKDAARAIEQHEDMQQKTDMENQRLIEQLQHNIEQMESKMMHSEAQKSMDVLCNGQIKRMEDEVNKLECALKEADLERKASHCQIQKLEHELNERQESLISCEAKIEELAIKNAELVHKMERHEKATELSNNELKYQKAEIHMCVNENQRLVNSLSGIEHELIRQSSSLKEATSAMDMQRHTIQLLEDTIKEKDCAYSRLLKRLIECEGIISKQGAEMDLVRRENEFFRALIDSLQRHNTNQQLSMERVAIVQPMRNSDNYDNNNNNVAVGNRIERSDSLSSLHSNFSSISILCVGKDPKARTSMVKSSPIAVQTKSAQHQCIHCKGCRRSSSSHIKQQRQAAALPTASQSTAFYNYSQPSLTGFRQFLWPWANLRSE